MNHEGREHDPGARLDAALRAALAPPPAPSGLRARVLQAARADELAHAGMEAATIATRQRALELERERELARLRRDFVRVHRGTLALIAALAFGCGAAVSIALPVLARWLGRDAPGAAPLYAVLAGLLAASLVWYGDDLRRRLPGQR